MPQPKINAASPAPRVLSIPAEEASIRQLIANGKSKTALDRAKDLHKSSPSQASEALLIDAYAARIQSLLDQNLTLEATSLLNLVRDRYPAAEPRLAALKAASAARAGALDELLAPLANPALGAEQRAAIEQAVQNTVVDLAAVAACPALPVSHDLRVAAAAIDRAFAAAVSGPVTDEEIALLEVSRRSPLSPWKLLVRAIAHFYRREDDLCRECLAAIKPDSAPARLIPAMRCMLGAKPASPLTPVAEELVLRTAGNLSGLRAALANLDRAFSDRAEPGRVFQLVRLAMQECRRSAPEQVETLKRLAWVRGAGLDLDGERMTAALQGMPRQDATFFRELAHTLETYGDPDSLARACEFWEEFRHHAIQENWFGAKGVEVATLYMHMAGLARRVDDEPFHVHTSGKHRGRLPPEEIYYLFPEMLYERACIIDPHPENFSRWLEWAARKSEKHGADVAKAWHKLRPKDIEPLLYLMQEAEARRAYPSALTYLEKAERIDAVHTVVRAARLRLLAGGALRHLEQKKPHLAVEKLKALAALPQSRQGDRPAFLAALKFVIAVDQEDTAAMDEARAEANGFLKSSLAAGMLALGVAAAAKRKPIGLPPVKALSEAQLLDLSAFIARVVAIAKDFGILKFQLPFAYMEEAYRKFPQVQGSLDTSQLRTLAEAALAGGNLVFAYQISGEGLSRGGPTQARFLFLRARSVPKWDGERHSVCAAAAAALARRQHDLELAGQAVDLVRAVFESDAFSLTADQAEEVVRKEIGERKYPIHDGMGPDYSALMPEEHCDCPKCRAKRGEIPAPFDGEEEFDEAKMEEMFFDRVPPGMPPEAARTMFEIVKESFLSGIEPDEILPELEKLERGGRSSGGKRKKGKRK